MPPLFFISHGWITFWITIYISVYILKKSRKVQENRRNLDLTLKLSRNLVGGVSRGRCQSMCPLLKEWKGSLLHWNQPWSSMRLHYLDFIQCQVSKAYWIIMPSPPLQAICLKRQLVKNFNGRNFCFTKILLKFENFRCTTCPLLGDGGRRVAGGVNSFLPMSFSICHKHVCTEKYIDIQIIIY